MLKSALSVRVPILLAVLTALFLLSSCSPQRSDYLNRVKALEEGDTASMTEAEIETLEQDIKDLEKSVEDITSETRKLGTFYRMLAVNYFDSGMFGPASDNLQKAMRIYPENHVLYYYQAICIAKLSRTKEHASDRNAAMLDAEHFYRQALSIKPNYRDALYGLSVLYVFELSTPDRAVPLLESLVSMDEKNTDARFLLGRAYASLGAMDEARKMYESIVEIDPQAPAADSARDILQQIGGGA